MSGATPTLRRYEHHGVYGRLVVPAARNLLDDLARLPWGGDNGAFSGFDEPAFVRMLDDVAPYRQTCKFVALPDVVGDAAATASLFSVWRGALVERGLPVALVLQDGIESYGVPWDKVDAVFVGGTTAFKLGPVAESLIREAKRRGKWVHVGRVNSIARIRRFQSVGADSFDGTALSRFPDVHFSLFLNTLKHEQIGLELP